MFGDGALDAGGCRIFGLDAPMLTLRTREDLQDLADNAHRILVLSGS
jgi:hypothetical protein